MDPLCKLHSTYVCYVWKIINSNLSLSLYKLLQIDTFRQAIYNRISSQPDGNELRVPEVAAAQENGVDLIFNLGDPASFRPFGFVDCFGIKTCRPGISRDISFIHDLQRAFYSGYFRAHGLKAQVVFLPNGMVGSIYVASLAQNDRGMVNLSGLNDYLVYLLHEVLLPPQFQFHPAIYGDGIYTVMLCIISRFTGQLSPQERAMNIRMAGVRMSIEHCLGLHHIRFKIFNHPDLLKLFHRGEEAQHLVLVSFFNFELLQLF